jgi:hypothetical protein
MEIFLEFLAKFFEHKGVQTAGTSVKIAKKTKSSTIKGPNLHRHGSWIPREFRDRWIDPNGATLDQTVRCMGQKRTRLVQVNRSGSLPLYNLRGRSRPHLFHSFLSLTLRFSRLLSSLTKSSAKDFVGEDECWSETSSSPTLSPDSDEYET